MRLSGLGFAGEYACIMRCANGFATGNGRFAAGGVTRLFEPAEEAGGGDVSGLYVGVVPCSGGDGGEEEWGG